MSSTRLTKNIRDDIRTALMNRAYQERKNNIESIENELGMAVYNDNYSPEQQIAMNALPDEFFKRTNIIHAAFAGDYCHINLLSKVPVGNQHIQHYFAIKNYPVDHGLTEEFLKLKKMKEEYEHDRQRLDAEAFGILVGCSTVKKLIETWPEIEPILRELNIPLVQTKETFLPAVIQDMNTLFCLARNGEVGEDDALQLAA